MSYDPASGFQASQPLVVRVIARLNLGGPAHHVIALSRELEPRYHTVLVTGTVSADEADMLPAARAAGIDVRVIPDLGREISFRRDFRTVLALVRIFRNLRPVLVCTHTAKAGTVGRVAALLARVPVRVHTFHGHVFDGYFSRWKTEMFLVIERLLARATTRIITISQSQRDDIVSRYRVASGDRVAVVPLGLPLQRFRGVRGTAVRHELALELGTGTAPIIAIVGRLVPIKNHDLFLDAAALLVEQLGPCTFAIVGDGEERPRLEARVRQMGLEEHVRFLGWRSDLEAIYAGADVVALSSHNEGTPVCLIEAMAAGCPVVATAVGGVGDVLEHGALGVLTQPGDAAALAAGIAGVLQDPVSAQRRAAAAEVTAHENFSVERLVTDITHLYDELLHRVPAETVSC